MLVGDVADSGAWGMMWLEILSLEWVRSVVKVARTRHLGRGELLDGCRRGSKVRFCLSGFVKDSLVVVLLSVMSLFMLYRFQSGFDVSCWSSLLGLDCCLVAVGLSLTSVVIGCCLLVGLVGF